MKLSTAMRHVADLWPEFANQIGGAPSEKIRALEALVRGTWLSFLFVRPAWAHLGADRGSDRERTTVAAD